jgi:protein-L-isoaspartate(D-aspartate) O-methyltransferase
MRAPALWAARREGMHSGNSVPLLVHSMIDFAHARTQMVENQLRTVGVSDKRLLAAMMTVPREHFVAAAQKPIAYTDVVQPIGVGRFLAAPAPFARLVQLAEITEDDAVLDVGAGTGYSTAVLAAVAHEVTALESDPILADIARRNLTELGIANVRLVDAPLDGSYAPGRLFDAIIIEGAVDREPSAFFPLLAEGGRMVALVRHGSVSTAHLYVRAGTEVAGRAEFNAALPPLPLTPRPQAFVF